SPPRGPCSSRPSRTASRRSSSPAQAAASSCPRGGRRRSPARSVPPAPATTTWMRWESGDGGSWSSSPTVRRRLGGTATSSWACARADPSYDSRVAVETTRAPTRALAIPAWAWLAAIVLLSAVFYYLVGRRMVAPFILTDELIYSEAAKSFAANGHLFVR